MKKVIVSPEPCCWSCLISPLSLDHQTDRKWAAMVKLDVDVSTELTQRQKENKSPPLLSPFFSQLWMVAEEAQQYFPKPGGPTRQEYSLLGQIAWALCWQINKTTNMLKKIGNTVTNVKLNRGLVWVCTGPNHRNSCSRCKHSPL